MLLMIIQIVGFIIGIIGIILGSEKTFWIGGMMIYLIDLYGFFSGTLKPLLPGITYGLCILLVFLLHWIPGIYVFDNNISYKQLSAYGCSIGGMISILESIFIFIYYHYLNKRQSNII